MCYTNKGLPLLAAPILSYKIGPRQAAVQKYNIGAFPS